MDLRRLSHVVVLAEELHFVRAAERVHLSQPAFSRSIQTIEAELGLRLFERGERGVSDVRPTPAGLFVIEGARKLLFDARCLRRNIDLYRDVELGDASFGTGPFPAVMLMPRVLAELRREHPKVGLRVEESNWKQLLERLRAEAIEFFVSDTTELPRDASLTVRMLVPHPVDFFARAGHPLVGRPCTFEEVWDYGLASATPPEVMKNQLTALLGTQVSDSSFLALECDNFAIPRAVALTTDTVLAATRALVSADTASGALALLDILDRPSLIVQPGIVSLTGRAPSPMAQKAMECVERVARELAGAAVSQA